MIRKAEEKDFLDILHLAEIFWSETEFEDPFDFEHVLEMIKASHLEGLLAVVDEGKAVGFIAGVTSPLLGNGSVRIAAELAYYILPKYRGRGLKLLKFYENLVRDKGVKYSAMMSLQSCEPEKANRIYEHMDYHLSEMTYVKVM